MRSLPFLLLVCLALLFMIGGAEADEPLLLYGGENWYAIDNEPPEVGDGALGVTWNQTGVATDALSVSIVGQGSGYSPSAPSVQIGTTVTWTNDDTQTHTVTDEGSQFDSFDIAPGETWSMTFTEVGTFEYYCKYHLMMKGSITVLSDSKVDEQARTDFLEIWTKDELSVCLSLILIIKNNPLSRFVIFTILGKGRVLCLPNSSVTLFKSLLIVFLLCNSLP